MRRWQVKCFRNCLTSYQLHNCCNKIMVNHTGNRVITQLILLNIPERGFLNCNKVSGKKKKIGQERLTLSHNPEGSQLCHSRAHCWQPVPGKGPTVQTQELGGQFYRHTLTRFLCSHFWFTQIFYVYRTKLWISHTKIFYFYYYI